MDFQRVLVAIAEPQRYRIVTLLAEGPRTVGEIASALSALQPQTTKHLQALESAGVIGVHRLGRRRLASLERQTLRSLAEHLGELAEPGRDDDLLREYAAAVRREVHRAATGAVGARTLQLRRHLDAGPAEAWAAWIEPGVAPRWWAPDHFVVSEFTMPPVPGAELRMSLREADGAEYDSAGRMLAAQPGALLEFELAPLGPDGSPLFAAVYRAEFASAAGDTTDLLLTICVDNTRPEAASALGGLEIGWGQLLDNLATLLRE